MELVEVVMKRQEMLLLSPNTRWTLPREVADQLIDRGAAEEIEKAITSQEKKGKGAK